MNCKPLICLFCVWLGPLVDPKYRNESKCMASAIAEPDNERRSRRWSWRSSVCRVSVGGGNGKEKDFKCQSSCDTFPPPQSVFSFNWISFMIYHISLLIILIKRCRSVFSHSQILHFYCQQPLRHLIFQSTYVSSIAIKEKRVEVIHSHP